MGPKADPARIKLDPLTVRVIVAYIHDRREQYSKSSGSYDALCILGERIARGDAEDAYRHGELDDLLKEKRRG